MRAAAPMTIGVVGLGRMGANIARRLMAAGHTVVAHDIDPAAVTALVAEGAIGAGSLADLAAALPVPRAVWVMVPAGRITEATVAAAAEVLDPGDTIIDGGNTHYTDDLRRAELLAARGIHHIDCGTSGGVWGAQRGFCLMIGGERSAVDRLKPIFAALAPGEGAAPRTPGRTGHASPAEQGFLHCGPSGAGHFVKMVHNGIEYGLMAAYAEGLNILANADAGLHPRDAVAVTAPLTNPEHYQYRLDVTAITELWRRGSVVGSWLLDLTAAALQSRFDSQGSAAFANKILSAMRQEFGGHHEKAE